MKQSSKRMIFSGLVAATVLLTSAFRFVESKEESTYGVDVSFPIHHTWDDSTKGVSDERRAVYENYMKGCREKWGSSVQRCDSNEQDRIDMTLTSTAVHGGELCGAFSIEAQRSALRF